MPAFFLVFDEWRGASVHCNGSLSRKRSFFCRRSLGESSGSFVLHNNGTMRGASHSVRLLSPNRGQPGRLALLRRRRGAFPMPGKLQAARAGAISL